MKHTASRMSSYFPNRWPLSYLNLIKNMKTYIRRQQHKKIKHQDIKQKEPPQKYRLGTISNTKLLAGLNRFCRILTSPSASAVVHNRNFAFAKTKVQISCAIAAQLMSAFVFATQIVQLLFYLHPNFQAYTSFP